MRAIDMLSKLKERNAALLEKENKKKDAEAKKEAMRLAFIKCEDKCICETAPRYIIRGYKQCRGCLNVLKSQCSKSSCVVDGKKPLMITAPTATKRSSKELLKEMVYEEDSDSEDEDNDSDVYISGEEYDNVDEDKQDSDYDNENDADNEINVGDFVKITQDPYIGYYAVILQKSIFGFIFLKPGVR